MKIVFDIVFGIPCGHPDDASPAAFDVSHLFDCGKIQAASCEIGANASKNFKVRMEIATKVRVIGGLVVMHFDDEATHAGFLGKARQFQCVEGTAVVSWPITVRIDMRVDVDRAV